MENIEKIIELAKLNNNKLDISFLDNFDISEEDFGEVMKILQKLNIELIEEDQEEINKYSKGKRVLTREEEQDLFRRYKQGEKSVVETLLECNEGLVWMIARRYESYVKANGFDLDDVLQEGRMGLLRAIEKFNPDLGYKFSTYAMWWIEQGISRFAMKTVSKKASTKTLYKAQTLSKYRAIYLQKNGVEPTKEECCEALNITPETLDLLLGLITPITSLNKPVNDDTDTTLQDFIVDEKSQDPFFDIEKKEIVNDILDEVKKKAGYRAYIVLCKRYGINSKEGTKTLDEIGKEHGITRERVRQLELKGLKAARLYLAKKRILKKNQILETKYPKENKENNKKR